MPQQPKPRRSFVFWLGVAGGVLLLFTLLCFFFIRRSVVEYRLAHQFPVHDPAFFQSAHALADPLPIRGNKIVLLHNGDTIFPSMLQAITAAEKSINFEAYLFSSGQVGNRFIEALAVRARAGVKVRVLLDGAGSGTGLDNADVERLKESGCSFAYYHPIRSWRLDRMNLRSHRRIMVVDGNVAFTGGVGFADTWLGNADAPDHWREVHARIEGPLVSTLQAAFQQHWFKATGETLTGEDTFPVLGPAGTLKAQVIVSHAFTSAPLALVQAVSFASAEKRISISNAYCAPSPAQTEALIAAVKRGVKVRLLLPGLHNDQPATKAAGRSAYGDLLRGGVEIYEYQPTMLHAKTMVVDGLFSVFGSSNFDARSTEINEELDITVYDAGFGQEMEEVFERDLENAKPYTLDDFNRRPILERLTEYLAAPFHSQL